MAMKTEPTEAMVKTDFGSLSGPTSLGGIGYNNYCGQRYSPHQAVLSPYSHYNAFQNTGPTQATDYWSQWPQVNSRDLFKIFFVIKVLLSQNMIDSISRVILLNL